MEQKATEENANVHPESQVDQIIAYGGGDEGKLELEYALRQIQHINDDLNLRERNSIVFNGIPYSRAYLFNQQKAINYAPPRNPKDDREVSLGTIHEKIIAFAAIFIKYRFKRRIKCYGKDGSLIPNMGEFYDLAIEFSYRMEEMVKKLALIYWEVFTQGNAFVLEDWDVRTNTSKVAYDATGAKVTPDMMDYTYEFLETLKFKDGDEYQVRKAISRVLDGRMVIFGNPEIEEVQDQPRICIEEEISRSDAELLYGNLSRWDAVPDSRENIDKITPEKMTLFSQARLAKPKDSVLVHRLMDKPNNRFNLFLNGMMMLPRETPFNLFWPRNNYPLTNVPAERLTGSIYARSIPAKTKFNADYIDWILKNLSLKFEQGMVPAILAKGKYTLSRNMFRAGEVTHGVAKADYEKADPDNKGVTPSEFSFVNLIKEIIETQTLNPTSTGEFDPNATATQISITDQNQRDKLAYLLDGISNGFMDMSLRRAETIESKYTIKQKETMVKGKKINVYQNFNISIGGVNNSVIFDDTMSDPMQFDHKAQKNNLFKQAFQAKKNGQPSTYYIADPMAIRRGQYDLDIEIVAERIKDTNLQVEQLWDEFTQLINTFQDEANKEEMKKIYLEVSGRPSSIFNSAAVMKLKQISQGQDPTPAGQPNAKGNIIPGLIPKNKKAPMTAPAMLS